MTMTIMTTLGCLGLVYRIIAIFIVVVSGRIIACHALAFNNNHASNNNNNKINPNASQQQHAVMGRRQAMALVLGTATASAIFRTSSNDDGLVAHAACIAGDTSVDCIGSYKEPIPKQRRGSDGGFKDIHMKQYTLRANRDDVVITTPDTLDDAIGILTDQRLALDEMERLVLTSSDNDALQQAGILLLAAMPKLTVAGRFAVTAVPSNLTRMIQPMLAQVEEAAATLDKTIAMGIRGKNSMSLTVAQLAVLKDLSQTKLVLDSFIQLTKMGQSIQVVKGEMS